MIQRDVQSVEVLGALVAFLDKMSRERGATSQSQRSLRSMKTVRRLLVRQIQLSSMEAAPTAMPLVHLALGAAPVISSRSVGMHIATEYLVTSAIGSSRFALMSLRGWEVVSTSSVQAKRGQLPSARGGISLSLLDPVQTSPILGWGPLLERTIEMGVSVLAVTSMIMTQVRSPPLRWAWTGAVGPRG